MRLKDEIIRNAEELESREWLPFPLMPAELSLLINYQNETLEPTSSRGHRSTQIRRPHVDTDPHRGSICREEELLKIV